jgi:hypothetical protein
MADNSRWVYLTNERRVCDGCKREERLAKSRHQFKDEDGKIQSKVTGTWIPLSKSKNVQHNDSCVLSDRTVSAKKK